MKKLIILLIVITFYNLNGQTFNVGDNSCNYKTVNQVFNTYCSLYTSSSQSYTIDLDGDSQPDIIVTSSCQNYPSSNIRNSISVGSPTNSSCQFAKNTVTTTPQTTVLNMPVGTPVASAPGGWVSGAFLYSYFFVATNGVSSGSKANPFYVGFRKILGTDTIYGWLHMSSLGSGALYDYAFKHTDSNLLGVSFTNTSTTVCHGSNLSLTATPSGGLFNGTGVAGNVFTPPSLGTFQVYYTDGCTNAATLNVTVNPTVSAVTSNSLICPAQPVTLTAHGALTYTWSNGSNSQTTSVNPSASTTYSVIGTTLGAGCSNTAAINQVVGSPTVIATSSSSIICLGASANLNATGALNYLWSTGDSNASCTSSPTSVATFSVIGTNPGGCGDTAFITVNVNGSNYALDATSNHSVICSGDTAILSLCCGSSTGYILYGPPNYTTNISYVAVSPTVTTTFKIRRKNSLNGCDPVGYYTQYVSSCVGINELSLPNNLFSIFPNPSSGEFEIKGIKEETIFITNELGQLIETKTLNSQNNYFIKINDLQNGIYFVGNDYMKQKIVIIK
ncbi:MAG: psrP1 [Bacteroidota bacterium]|jgi:hypothetical protein|nr:psrP1 [Bacteroidota bacterium]